MSPVGRLPVFPEVPTLELEELQIYLQYFPFMAQETAIPPFEAVVVHCIVLLSTKVQILPGVQLEMEIPPHQGAVGMDWSQVKVFFKVESACPNTSRGRCGGPIVGS